MFCTVVLISKQLRADRFLLPARTLLQALARVWPFYAVCCDGVGPTSVLCFLPAVSPLGQASTWQEGDVSVSAAISEGELRSTSSSADTIRPAEPVSDSPASEEEDRRVHLVVSFRLTTADKLHRLDSLAALWQISSFACARKDHHYGLQFLTLCWRVGSTSRITV